MTAPVLPLIEKITINSKKSEKQRILEAQFGNGYRQVAKDGLNSNIDHWEIQYAPLDGAQLTELDTFLNLVGCDVWFTWTPIGETVSKKWRIDKDTKQRTQLNTSLYLVSFSMTQCFDLGT